MRLRFALGFALLALLAAPARSDHYVFSSNITTGDQYDLYPIDLRTGDHVRATLVCDETTPGNGDRPLDPVFSAYAPGVDPSDIVNATFYNDDGFGTDDYPNGVDCNAFDSSILLFVADQDGEWYFRADGFGSTIGPYTMTIDTTAIATAIPTLDEVGLVALAIVLAGLSLVFLKRRRA